ncbi:hypothetical protein [Achromobacter anxifer]|uniref:hypothetical protein n=1 Tax=Achromobacter anxifer TaxID=1287737 RepID=UPI002157F756|nr:hypothetical protein [Achromobacter anxifer]
MRSDRELLELAARAALGRTSIPDQHVQMIERGWNPLDNDSEPFRLAVRMRMHILIGTSEVTVTVRDGAGKECMAQERFRAVDGGEYEATRRAIVRAAAEIGAQAHPDNKDEGANG